MAIKHLNGYTSHNKVHLVRGGLPYFELLEELIDKAQHSIHLQVYIYEEDDTGMRITQALIRAASRGVVVHLLLDGYASGSLSSGFVGRIQDAGIRFRWFEPLLKSRKFYVGRRMHHKIFVADGRFSLVGGINISNRYNDMPDKAGWLDCAVYVNGEASKELYMRCLQMWYRRNIKSEAVPFVVEEGKDCLVRIRINDWVRNKNQISRSYLEMFHKAASQITIMSSYFLPGRVFRKNLRKAAGRGVRVRVILTKISDVTLAKLAERFFYPWLLKRNIEVYEYRKKIVHAKIGTYDSQWVTIGSYNFNNISAYASVELNLDIDSQPFAHTVDRALEEIILRDCDRITMEDFERRTNLLQRLVHFLAYESFRLILFLFTFYFRQDKK
jgi:cardiolipin synthase